MAITKITADVIDTGTITADNLHATLDLSSKTLTLPSAQTATTQSAGDNSTKVATTAYVETATAALVDSAPGTLNTLNELAAALGDDANFSTTVTNSIATKLPLAGGSLTGALDITATGNQLTLSRSGFDDILFGTGTANSQAGFHITNTTDSVVPFSMHENALAATLVIDSTGELEINPAGADGSLKITSDANSGNNVVISQGFNAYITASNNLYMGVGGTADDLNIVNGNVGINETSPTSYGNSQATLVIKDSTGPAISWNDTGQTRDWFAIAQGSGLHFNYADAGGSSSASNVTSVLQLDNSGHVGIGMDPASGSSSVTTLNVGGAIVFNPGTGSPYNSNARHYVLESRYNGSNHLTLGYIANGSTHTAGFVSSQNNLPLHVGVGTGDNLVLTSNNNVGMVGGAQIGAGQGYGPANNAAGNGTIMLYNTSTGNMDFNQSYSHARYYFYHGGNEVFRIEDGGHSGVYGYSYVQTTTHGAVGYGALNSGYHHTMALSGPSTFYWNNRCEASGGFHTYSDERLKENITVITGALDKVALMEGVTFNWKDTEERNKGETGKQFGVTAQNMLTVDAELPSLNPDPLATQAELDDDELDTDYYSMDYSRITPFLIEAVKELKTKLEAAEARITELEG